MPANPGEVIESPQRIIDLFNEMVRNQTSYLNSATWYSGNFPNGSDSRLGSRYETPRTAADLNNKGYLAATVVFNILHGFAMELTRVRRVEAWHETDALPLKGGTQVTALNSNYAAYFPIPFQPEIGQPVTGTEFNSFLSALRSRVNNIRTSSAYEIDIVTCHNSCHSSCHSSRNRR